MLVTDRHMEELIRQARLPEKFSHDNELIYGHFLGLNTAGLSRLKEQGVI